MTMRSVFLVSMLCCWTAAGQQDVVKPPNEPVNLAVIKQQLIDYHTCTGPTCYVKQMEQQSEIAIALLRQSVATAKPGDKLALVLDIDETSLANWSVEQTDDFGYIPADSNACIAQRCGKAIPSTLRIFHEAIKNNVAVFFITGRPETQRTDTAANLKAEGYDQWEHLYLRPVDHKKDQSTTAFKSGDRAEIVSQGFRIVLNVGDQMSDLEGVPMAEHSVKLPNPFYFIL